MPWRVFMRRVWYNILSLFLKKFRARRIPGTTKTTGLLFEKKGLSIYIPTPHIGAVFLFYYFRWPLAYLPACTQPPAGGSSFPRAFPSDRQILCTQIPHPICSRVLGPVFMYTRVCIHYYLQCVICQSESLGSWYIFSSDLGVSKNV